MKNLFNTPLKEFCASTFFTDLDKNASIIENLDRVMDGNGLPKMIQLLQSKMQELIDESHAVADPSEMLIEIECFNTLIGTLYVIDEMRSIS